jgi:hypothetical protein
MEVIEKQNTGDIIRKSITSTYNATIGFAIGRLLVNPVEPNENLFDNFDNITNVDQLSHTIVFLEDQKRRKQIDDFDNVIKWVIIGIPIIFAVAIGAVIFLIGTGMVR